MNSILIVEDSPLFGKLAKIRLETEFDKEIIWTKTLLETKTILKSNRASISVALVDYNLPDAPRGEVIDEVAACGIPVIIFTGDLSDEVRDHVWSKQVADYVLKDDPNCFDYIIHAIQRLSENSNCKVLVVDDSPLYRKIFCDLLYIQQYQVIAAKNGEECLAILEQHPDITLILSDYNMPGRVQYKKVT